METRNQAWSLTRERIVILAEAAVIAFLGFWMTEEYANNVFLRDYVASLWAANWWVAPGSIAALVVVGAVVYYMAGASMEETLVGKDRIRMSNSMVREKELVSNSGVVVMDSCPFCNLPLRTVGDDRFQCRRCKRFFKR